MNNTCAQNLQFSKQGYCEGKFETIGAVNELQFLCQEHLKKEIGGEVTLTQYHNHVRDEQLHRNLHVELAKMIKSSRLHEKLVEDNASVFQSLIGPDVDIQVEPYLRISRPNVSEDNIGLHRDTMYGNSAYELSCIVPLVDFVKGAAVNVIPGSQRYGPLEYTEHDVQGVTKGSEQNSIGFLYSQKHIHNLQRRVLYAPLLNVGEYLMFSLCVIHGQEMNSSEITRWSIDFRFKNRYSPLNSKLKKGYYKPLLSGGATLVAKEYYSHNEAEQGQLIANSALLKSETIK